jgi:hypothetical protein
MKLVRGDDTTLRLGGNGDNLHLSWAADGRQYFSLDDGTGWFRERERMDNSRLWAVEGEPHDATFHDVPAYPELSFPSEHDFAGGPVALYYGLGVLALDGCIFHFLSTTEGRRDSMALSFTGVKAVYSPDNGRTWCNQDGSTPVVWEAVGRRSRDTMLFFEEPQRAFSALTILQMGRNYELNRDGYMYAYAPNGATDGTMNQQVLFRTPKDRVLDRGAFEFFAGLRSDGSASWSAQIADRAVVQTFPAGFVSAEHAHSWIPSVVYNEPLGLYLMSNWGMPWCADPAAFASRPSYLGFWTALQPWGPWEQIHEEPEWLPCGDANARAYEAQIAPKWIAPDGKSFWLVWSDFQSQTIEGEVQMPYYAFNTQRVDVLD